MKFSGKVFAKNNYKKFTSFGKNMDEVNKQFVALAALEVRNEAIQLLAANGDGTPVMRYGPKRMVYASKPGDPPNSDTGRLQQSIKSVKDGKGWMVGTNLKYGAWLEFGTQDMARRPWLSVALKNVIPKLAELRDIAMNNFFKRLGK